MGCPPRVMRGAAAHAITASGVNPHGQAATGTQGSIVLGPVGHPVLLLGDVMAPSHLVAWIGGVGALNPAPCRVTRCGRTPGAPAAAFGSARWPRSPPRSPVARPFGNVARHQ